VAAAGGLFQLGDDGRLRQLLALEESLPGGVPNDSCCDPAGNLWVGITTVGEVAGAGSLYRVTPDLTATTVLSGLTVPNGIDWSPDGRTAYFADSPAYRIDAFQFDPASQSLGERSTFASFQPCGGAPDGLTVNAEGYVWVALWGVWSVRRYRPDGQLDLVVEVPVERVSSYGFGGAGLRNLYVTTASPGADADSRQAQPAAGGLFRYLAPAAGRPVRPFRLAEQGPPPADTGAPPRP
jgi:sugar lactone lactonase YvrE